MTRRPLGKGPQRYYSMGICRATGKRMWDSRDGARQVIRSLRAHGKSGDTRRLTTYRCTRCQHWHVGHRPTEGERS